MPRGGPHRANSRAGIPASSAGYISAPRGTCSLVRRSAECGGAARLLSQSRGAHRPGPCRRAAANGGPRHRRHTRRATYRVMPNRELSWSNPLPVARTSDSACGFPPTCVRFAPVDGHEDRLRFLWGPFAWCASLSGLASCGRGRATKVWVVRMQISLQDSCRTTKSVVGSWILRCFRRKD